MTLPYLQPVAFALARRIGPQLQADAAKLTDSTASSPVPWGVCAQRDSSHHRHARTLNGCVSHHEASPRQE